MAKKISLVYAGLLAFMFWGIMVLSVMSFTDKESFTGPFALVFGMIVAIIYLVKRDKEMRDMLNSQNKKIIEAQDARIKELEKEVRELRKE